MRCSFFSWIWRMGSSAALLAGVLSWSCAVSLDDEQNATAPPSNQELPTSRGCVPFAEQADIDGVQGGLRSMKLTTGQVLWLPENLEVQGESRAAAGLISDASLGIDSCLAEATPVGDLGQALLEPSPRGNDLLLSPLDGFSDGTTDWLFYRLYEPAPDEPFGIKLAGIGIAAGDGNGRFTPSADLLWTGDRPEWGTAAHVDGEHVYVWGCIGARFLSADCYLARAPLERVTEVGAYEYSLGGGTWTPRIDEAFALVEAGTQISIAEVPALDRYVMAYATAFGETLVLRTGVSPSGPWSAPVEAARCELPNDDAFCQRVELHPELAANEGEVVLSYDPAIFGGSGPEYRTRLVTLAVPESLP